MKGKLYVYNAAHNHNNAYVTTVSANQIAFTKRELNDADKARSFIKSLSYPSTNDVIKLINNGGILNCPVTVNDIQRANQIYGPDIAILKGKTTSNQNATKINNEFYEPKYTTSKLILCADIMFIFGVAFLVVIAEKIELLIAIHLINKTSNVLKKAIFEIINVFEKYKFEIKIIKADGEAGISALKDSLEQEKNIDHQEISMFHLLKEKLDN